MRKIIEDLENYNYSIHKALADIMDISEKEAIKATDEMDLGEYINLTQSLDRDDQDSAREIMSKYTGSNSNEKNQKDDVEETPDEDEMEEDTIFSKKEKVQESRMRRKRPLNESGRVMGLADMNSLKRMRKLSGIKEDFEEELAAQDLESTIDKPVSDYDSFEPDYEYTGNVEVVNDYNLDDNSQAYQTISNCLDTVRNSISDIRLDEYKSLLVQLDELKNQTTEMGRSYLGERRKK